MTKPGWCASCNTRTLDFPAMDMHGRVGQRCNNRQCADYNVIFPLEPTVPMLPPDKPRVYRKNHKRAVERAEQKVGKPQQHRPWSAIVMPEAER